MPQASYFRPTTHLHVYRDILNETLSSQSVLAAWGRMGAAFWGAQTNPLRRRDINLGKFIIMTLKPLYFNSFKPPALLTSSVEGGRSLE